MMKVLAVDDELPIRQWLQFCISQIEGFSCITAANGSEALETFRTEQPDILLCDIEMPGGSGLELISRIRELDRHIRIIVLTSHSNFHYARTALQLDAQEYILKTELDEDGLQRVLQKTASAISTRKREVELATQSIRQAVAAQDLRQMESIQAEFMEALLNQNYTLAYQKISEVLTQAEAKPALLDSTKRLLKTMCLSFFYFAKDSSEISREQEIRMKKQIQEAETIDRLHTAVVTLCEPIIRDYTVVSRLSEPVYRAVRYIRKHYPDKITLTEIAEQQGFSPEHFSRIFSKETGVSFIAYINNFRMKQAVSLLETTDLKVYEIAEKVGFSSLSYFSTTFKKKIGMNPYEYQVKWKKSHQSAHAKEML